MSFGELGFSNGSYSNHNLCLSIKDDHSCPQYVWYFKGFKTGARESKTEYYGKPYYAQGDDKQTDDSAVRLAIARPHSPIPFRAAAPLTEKLGPEMLQPKSLLTLFLDILKK